MSIRRLPPHVVTPLQSSLVVPSLNAALCGLLCNALDADATTVTLHVDYTRGSCSAEDDGRGIPAAEFAEDGGLAKPHCTSKYPATAARHGRHGVLLAALGALARLTVVSSGQVLTLHDGRVLRRDQATPEQRLAAAHGTRVVVQDLFGCLPVRARQRPASDVAAWRGPWEALVHSVAALLLAWPRDVAVVLRASGRGRLPTATWRPQPDGQPRAARILRQAALCDRPAWIPVASSGSGMTIRGCMATTPSAAKHVQFLSIGIAPLADDGLYADINQLFAESQFGADRRAVDRWPMFCLGIEGGVNVDDLLDEGRQHREVLRALLRTLVVQFLTQQGYERVKPAKTARPAKRLKTGRPARPAPSPFSAWPQVKPGQTQPKDGQSSQSDSQTPPNDQTRISRDSLAAATVVGQVDNKYVLVRARRLLVLVDQHAADERCRVEELFAGYFSQTAGGWQAVTTALDPPLRFALDAHERPPLAARQDHFRHWGVVYSVAEPTDDTFVLQVDRLPTSLVARCRHEQRLVVDLVRQDLWETPPPPAQTDTPLPAGHAAAWVQQFRGCPPGLLDLLHSRACHSAIRFNDALSMAACRDLLHRLQQCVFPFQCAHGRPSMVPLQRLC